MEQRLANTWRMTVNEKKFIETALLADLRVDGRRPFDYRRLTIKFGRQVSSLPYRVLVFLFILCFVWLLGKCRERKGLEIFYFSLQETTNKSNQVLLIQIGISG